MHRAALLMLMLLNPLWAGEPLRIAVAANFKPTLTRINALFEAEYGLRVTLTSASTGVLYSQIQHGAPFDLFFAADGDAPGKLAAAGFGRNPPFCYARGRLVLVGGDGSLEALTDPGRSLAIANPVTAPYGMAAMEVIGQPRFAPGLKRKLVRGNNVAQAYQFWHSGAARLALVPRSLAPVAGTPIPEHWHRPLEQHALVLKHNAAVDTYLKWFSSDNVRSLISDAGYEPCP